MRAMPTGPHLRASRDRSTRWRIALSFAFLASLLFFAVGVISARQARRQIEAQVSTSLLRLAGRLAGTLDIGMAERLHEMETLAALENLLHREFDAVQWRALVDRLQGAFPYYTWIGVADSHGKVIAGTGGLLEGRDVSGRPWFDHGLKKPFVGDVHEALLLSKYLPAPPDGEPLRLVDFAAPLERQGQVVAVLGSHLSWRWAEEQRRQLLASIDTARGIEMLLFNAKGQLLLGPTSPAWRTDPVAAIGSIVASGPMIATWSDGRRYLTAAVRIPNPQAAPGLDWTVLVRQPEDTAMASAAELQREIFAFGLAGALLFGACGWWLSGWLTAPLREVARQARQIAANDLPPSPRRDEVALLADSLGRLVEQLRRRERELLDLNGTLEHRIEARTALLRQANKDLESFGRSVSHDLKGPISSIGIVVGNLLSSRELAQAPDAIHSLKVVAAECERLCELVDELLALAMVEQAPLKFAEVEMDALARQAADESREGTLARVTIHALPRVTGDAVLLRQVWRNLIGNALKFSARVDSPEIEVDGVETGDEVVFSVRDNGSGFDMAQSHRLFEVFQRLHRMSEFPGTGVGLSIVKRVVHRHGGRVWAESSPGQGARFYFALPRRADMAPLAGAGH